MMNRFFSLAVLFVALAAMSSCGDIKQLQYVQGNFDSTRLSKVTFAEPVIQKGDILGITVYSESEIASSLYNQTSNEKPATGAGPIQAGTKTEGCLVEQDGSIIVNRLGRFSVEGLTKKQLSELLTKQFVEKNLLTNPSVDIRFLNFKITLVGDVVRPGVYSIPNEKVNIFEAIGLAGDLTNYARRDNILIVREKNGVREFGHIDLSKPEAFISPYYYLQQNDIIVVDVAKHKAAQTNESTIRNITVAASILSTIAIFLNVFKN